METLDEMRGSVRFPLELPVAIKTGPENHPAHTKDISAGGVLLYLEDDVMVGSSIEFTIGMPAAILGSPTDVTVFCTGRVVRVHQQEGRRSVAAVIDEYRFERA